MKNPRISVTLLKHDTDKLHYICQKRGINASTFVRRIVEAWLNNCDEIKNYERQQWQPSDTKSNETEQQPTKFYLNA